MEKVLDTNLKDSSFGEPKVQMVYKELKEEYGFVPNMYKRMSCYPSLLEMYTSGMKRFREDSRFSPIEQDVIFLTLSKLNDCRYCVKSHSVIALMKTGVDKELLNEINVFRCEDITQLP